MNAIPEPKGMWAGMTIIESGYLTVAGDPIQVRRSWRERWLSRPWRPWRTTRTVVPRMPDPQVYRMGRHTLVMHPETVKELRRQLQQAEDR